MILIILIFCSITHFHGNRTKNIKSQKYAFDIIPCFVISTNLCALTVKCEHDDSNKKIIYIIIDDLNIKHYSPLCNFLYLKFS